MQDKTFESAYKRLNSEQKKAVDTVEGPVMVVAGPGTGKTQILTLRIANILKTTDTEPENILALTFTEAATANMRKRLAELIGSPAYSVVISTFHGFANDIIQNNPEDFPAIVGSRPITEVDQAQIIQDIILDTELELLKPFGDTFFYVRSIVSAVNQLKREGVSVEQFAEIVKKEEKNFKNTDDLYHEKGAHKGKMKGMYQKLEKQINKNRELVKIYEMYQSELRKRKQYDYNDMIMETLRAMQENSDLLLRLQEEHQYILVDEHQDTNNAQNKILELLANFHDQPNIFVVGDEKQSIFRFQGASIENFFYFKHLYKNAELITLTQNYRSSQSILDSAHSVIAGEAVLSANAGHTERPIEMRAFSDMTNELYFVATDIKKQIESGVEASEIAVLYRNNNDVFGLADMLDKVGVSYVIESDQDLFSDPVIRKVLVLLRAINEFGNDEYLAQALHLDIFDLDPLDIFKVIRAASQKRKYTLYDVIQDEKLLKGNGLMNKEAFTEVYANLASWITLSNNTDLISFFERVVRESGILNQIIASPDAPIKLEALETLFNEVRSIVAGKPEATLADFFHYLDTLTEHGLLIKKKKTIGRSGCVRLMTAHKSKGLEFEHVYIIDVRDGKWGNQRRPELLPLLPGVFALIEDKDKDGTIDYVPEKNDDERRLFYVALTRAKQRVSISYATQNDQGREQVPSVFVGEIREELLEARPTDDVEKDFSENRSIQFAPTNEALAFDLKDFAKNLFLKQGLSVSALNNYLQSPWQYFYRNLVRIPAAPTKHQAYGIAVHAALADLFEALKKHGSVDKSFLIDRFTEHLDEQIISDTEHKELQAKGESALDAWFDEYSTSWNTNALTEYRINGVYLTPEIRLTGVLDKVEFISDTIVNVVDYKTGKPRSRNDLMGNTKNSTGDYYRQLVFYKLLLKYFKDGQYEMQSGAIDFIEPDDKGQLHREVFEISDDEVEELEETIKKVAREIMEGTFLDVHCDPDSCDYCDLVELIRPTS